MSGRGDEINAFLEAAGLAGAAREALEADASFRSYHRIIEGKRSFVLMDAPPGREDARPFAALSDYLASRGFSAPKVLARDYQAGFLLLEDLGDATYNRVLAEQPGKGEALYAAAVDVLVALHQLAPPKSLPLKQGGRYPLQPYGERLLFGELNLFPEWYLPEVRGGKPDPAWKKPLAGAFTPLFQPVIRESNVLTLRDYHADNLMWLDGRAGIARVGLLDFQDAVAGHAAYDLVSLLQDARRPFDEGLEKRMTARYLEGMAAAGRSLEPEDFLAAYQILGAQRNLKIIGIFTRLWRRDGKPAYPRMIPHVWSLVERNLAHPALKEAKAVIDALAPPRVRRRALA